jgi:hypothetical protein
MLFIKMRLGSIFQPRRARVFVTQNDSCVTKTYLANPCGLVQFCHTILFFYEFIFSKNCGILFIILFVIVLSIICIFMNKIYAANIQKKVVV